MSQATRIEDGLAFIKDTYSDCTILIAGGELLSAHRLVLHLQSPVFEVLLREKVTSDEETGTILDLQDDDPDALRAMLHFFYHGNYEVPQSMNGMAFHVAVAQIADKYETAALKDIAHRLFGEILSSARWTSKDLVDAATKLEEVIATTEDTDKMRNNIILAVSRRSFDLYGHPAFKSFIQAHPQWVIDLLKILDPESQSYRRDDAAVDGASGGSVSGDDHEAGGEEGSMSGCGNDQFKSDWDDTSNMEEEPTSSFPGDGHVLGPSKIPRTEPFWAGGIQKLPSKEFQVKARAARLMMENQKD